MSSSSSDALIVATSRPRILRRLLISLIIGLLVGAAVAAFSPGIFWNSWLATSLLAIPSVFCLISAWQWAGGGRILAWMVALAFLLRLVSGIGLSLVLPVLGYPEPEQQAGYLFKDAYARDSQAWDLAQSSRPLWDTFSSEFVSDQYGGLLALSAGVYRIFSPDAHRPFLVLILGAFVAALGVPFLFRASRQHWGLRAALIAGWIYTLYPDGIFFASSQMREPFVVGLVCIAFWQVITWDWRRPAAWFILLSSLAGIALFSSRVAGAAAGFLGLLFLLEYVVGHPERRWQIIGWGALGVGVLLVLLFSWEWFRSSTSWDVIVTSDDSGQIQLVIDRAAKALHLAREDVRVPIVTLYGLARPVLPAAIVSNAKSELMKDLSVVRAVGWYALAPFLIYALFTVWREPDPRKRKRAIWLALVVLAWLIIASARGGGDMTDNPRYRSLFLPWLALLAAWAVDWALARKDAWLWRWIAVEFIFLAVFTQWYVVRYYKIGSRMPFWETLALVTGLSALVLVGGLVWDRSRARLNAAPLPPKEKSDIK